MRVGLLDMQSPTTWVDKAGNAEAWIDGQFVHTVSALVGRARALAGSKRGRPAHFSATTIAVSGLTSRRIAERVEQFRHEIGQMLESVEAERDHVYRLELAFFPVADLTPMES